MIIALEMYGLSKSKMLPNAISVQIMQLCLVLTHSITSKRKMCFLNLNKSKNDLSYSQKNILLFWEHFKGSNISII
jgi:hypothetical protein